MTRMLALEDRQPYSEDDSFDTRAIARKSRKLRASSRRLLVEARLLLVESKRIVLWNAERRHGITRRPQDAELVRWARAEFDRAEDMYNAELANGQRPSPSAKLQKLYAKLAARGNAAVELMSGHARRLSPARRFDSAVRVQALEELVAQWREVEALTGGAR